MFSDQLQGEAQILPGIINGIIISHGVIIFLQIDQLCISGSRVRSQPRVARCERADPGSRFRDMILYLEGQRKTVN